MGCYTPTLCHPKIKFICAGLKIVAILTGLKQGYSKHQCFLSLWEGRKDDLHYNVVAFSTDMEEEYTTLKTIMTDEKYFENNWKICCDLKVVNILQGIISKASFPKYFCFLCNWDLRYPHNHYTATHWTIRTEANSERLNLRNEPIIKDLDKILLPPLHIKLGIVKKFIEVAIKHSPEVFECLKTYSRNSATRK